MVHVRRPVEAVGILRDEGLAPALRDLADDALDPLVPAVVDEVVGERPPTDPEAAVAAVELPL
jgi:hypothetical protein